MQTVTEEKNINAERWCGQRSNYQCPHLCLKSMALPGDKFSDSSVNFHRQCCLPLASNGFARYKDQILL